MGWVFPAVRDGVQPPVGWLYPPGGTQKKAPRLRGFFVLPCAVDQSPRVSSEALPPAAVVFTVTVFSVAKRSR